MFYESIQKVKVGWGDARFRFAQLACDGYLRTSKTGSYYYAPACPSIPQCESTHLKNLLKVDLVPDETVVFPVEPFLASEVRFL